MRDIRRTHHELVKLQDHLIYANPECFVPALPPPVTSAGAGTDEDEKRMKVELQRWFDVLSANPVLIRDEEIMLLVESDFGVCFLCDYLCLHATSIPPSMITGRRPPVSEGRQKSNLLLLPTIASSLPRRVPS